MIAMTVPESHTRHTKTQHTALVEWMAAVLNEALIDLLTFLRWVGRLIVGPKFEAPPTTEREPFGADEQTADELHALNVQHAADRDFGLLSGQIDVEGPEIPPMWPTDDTQLFTFHEWEQAAPGVAKAYLAELARGRARDASDLMGGAL